MLLNTQDRTHMKTHTQTHTHTHTQTQTHTNTHTHTLVSTSPRTRITTLEVSNLTGPRSIGLRTSSSPLASSIACLCPSSVLASHDYLGSVRSALKGERIGVLRGGISTSNFPSFRPCFGIHPSPCSGVCHCPVRLAAPFGG